MKIDKNIPIPKPTGKTGPHKKDYNYSELEVGDSILFEELDTFNKANSKACSIRAYLKARGFEYSFSLRKQSTGYRIWRTA
jgi:hypothetical protein